MLGFFSWIQIKILRDRQLLCRAIAGMNINYVNTLLQSCVHHQSLSQ